MCSASVGGACSAGLAGWCLAQAVTGKGALLLLTWKVELRNLSLRSHGDSERGAKMRTPHAVDPTVRV